MLAYLFLNKVAALTQSNSLSAICAFLSQLVRNIFGIAVFAGNSSIHAIVVFARPRRLNVIIVVNS